jgi:hypothetical protein
VKSLNMETCHMKFTISLPNQSPRFSQKYWREHEKQVESAGWDRAIGKVEFKGLWSTYRKWYENNRSKLDQEPINFLEDKSQP